MAQKWPEMTQNGPKIARTFPPFFLTEKAVPQTFSLLECMPKRIGMFFRAGEGGRRCFTIFNTFRSQVLTTLRKINFELNTKDGNVI